MLSSGTPEQKQSSLDSSLDDLKIDLTMSVNDDLSCPITRSLFFKPVTIQCGHTFEETALESWRKETDTCPTCREEISTLAPNMLVEDLVDRVLEKKPEAAKQLHYSSKLLLKVCEKESPREFKRLILLLCQCPDTLNHTVTLYQICSYMGGEKVISNAKIRSLITETALNYMIKSGPNQGKSAVFALALLPSILLEDPALTLKIGSEALNYRVADEEWESALYRIAKYDSGVELLYKYPSLCKKITAESLNYIIPNGLEKDYSILFWLSRKGGDLFLKYPFLCDLIGEKALNHVINDGPFQGYSALYNFSSLKKCEGIFLANPKLCDKINKKGMNQIIPKGEDKDESVVFHFISTDEGRDILRKHPSLYQKISTETFNHVMSDNEYKGYSSATYLAYKINESSLIFDTPLKDKVAPQLLAELQKKSGMLISKKSVFNHSKKRKRDEKDHESEYKNECRYPLRSRQKL